MERSRDWWVQSQADLRHAKHSYADGDYEWACFASHQAAEKAVKAVFQKYHLEGRGHTVSLLLGRLPESIETTEDLVEAAKALDKLYIPTRYPNGLEQGAPTEFYTRREAEEAIGYGQRIMDFCGCYLA